MSRLIVHVEGVEDLRRELRALGGPKLRRLAREVTRDEMIPVARAAKENAPVVSGRLRASIGQLAWKNRRGDSVGYRVGTRRDFTYTSTSGERMAQGRGKSVDKAVAGGARLSKTAAQQYARVIEFGVDRSGRVRRAAGPAHFLENAITSRAGTIVQNVAAALRRHVETTRVQ